ncbi:hypothetical protein E6Q11_02060 [Candidatus Dojkabacteria bacterium]|uniref:Uncharacterized protein n=1 Tax=Candidatus Dojkabacteria bacterium TaxID=2099670 RepID=A0A5C7J9U6_9BACT|nr:MAG: hypothetical protein E6Q11_02060 [Candidatus Dojkabacteria bacterium]
MKSEMMKKLEQVAFERTKPFCYGCYRQAPTGVCLSCGSDDLMRELPGAGVEYGLNWVIEHILREELTPVDLEAEFESSMEGCYADETQIGFIKVNTLWAIQQLDPTAWDMAKQEWVDSEEQEERIMTFDNGSTYYKVEDLESLE